MTVNRTAHGGAMEVAGVEPASSQAPIYGIPTSLYLCTP